MKTAPKIVLEAVERDLRVGVQVQIFRNGVYAWHTAAPVHVIAGDHAIINMVGCGHEEITKVRVGYTIDDKVFNFEVVPEFDIVSDYCKPIPLVHDYATYILRKKALEAG